MDARRGGAKGGEGEEEEEEAEAGGPASRPPRRTADLLRESCRGDRRQPVNRKSRRKHISAPHLILACSDKENKTLLPSIGSDNL